MYVRDEIAGLDQHLHIKDIIDQAASTALMDPNIALSCKSKVFGLAASCTYHCY
jgi:hypothetical protein